MRVILIIFPFLALCQANNIVEILLKTGTGPEDGLMNNDFEGTLTLQVINDFQLFWHRILFS